MEIFEEIDWRKLILIDRKTKELFLF